MESAPGQAKLPDEVGFSIESCESVVILNAGGVRPERFEASFRARSIEDLQSLTVRIVARKAANARSGIPAPV